MIFSSNIFIFLFLPVALLGHQILSRFGKAWVFAWLTFISLLFYGYWSTKYLILLFASIAGNYMFAYLIARNNNVPKRQGRFLVAAVFSNIALLFHYKYLFPSLNFLHVHGLMPRSFPEIVLPLGISFFTFTQIAFLIDLKQGIAELPDLLVYMLFVTFFPHLIAGPIIHPRTIIPQFIDKAKTYGLSVEDLTLGATWFVLGLTKKVLIADRVGPVADAVFDHASSFRSGGMWIGASAYTVQLYFDFSGYSDMAIGIARMFSIRFPLNFNSPFKSDSVSDYWSRWHMSMSQYFNDYVYSPISQCVRDRRRAAGKSSLRKVLTTPEGFVSLVAFPTMATMVLAGIWHGAGLQFLMWGAIYGFYLIIYHGWRLFLPAGNASEGILPKPVAILFTYICVIVAQVFFRAPGVLAAWSMVRVMFGGANHGIGYSSNPNTLPAGHLASLHGVLLALGFCYLLIFCFPNTQEMLGQQTIYDSSPSLKTHRYRWIRWSPRLATSIVMGVLLSLCIIFMGTTRTFLYFQF